MSSDAHARALSREGKVWSPFAHSFPFNDTQTDDRTIIYGLYSGSFRNQHGYLNEIETTDLSNLLADYNAKIADLTLQEQMVVSEIVSKKYLASIDKLIHDQKLTTKATEIDAEDAEWDAKIAALSADQAALLTMAAKVTSETEKTSARITEIQSYIAIEGYNLTEVDVQIAEKAIESAKVDIQKLDASNGVLKIQMDTVSAAMQLIDVDLQIARTRVDIAHTDRDIAKIGLLENELTIEQAQTAVAEAELPIAESRVVLAGAKSGEVDKELTYYEETLMNQANESYLNKIDLMNLKQLIRENELTKRQEKEELDIYNKLAASQLDVDFANMDKADHVLLDAKKVSIMEAKVSNVREEALAAVRVAETLAAAKIATTLTHTIKKAT